MRICIDIDGTICSIKKDNQTYEDVIPFVGAVEKIKLLKESGHYIIFCTARHMKTCNSNIGKVLALQGQTLTMWLSHYGFVYDELWFGKPYAEIYIDDKAFKFNGSWEEINDHTLNQYV
ncbi:MAG: HAD hydrolase family protein [Bacteroidetes bacterium]|nr:HAD hydrolase family protein [Bacteroidota bacterium]